MGAPQARLSELGERLIDFGWEVEALTALPNYPTGKVFAGYDRHQPVVEQIGRIRTVRVPLYTAKTGFTKRLRSYFSFAASASRHGPRLCQRPDLAVRRVAAAVHRLCGPLFVVALEMPVRLQRERSLAGIGDSNGDRQAGHRNANGGAAGAEAVSKGGRRDRSVGRDYRRRAADRAGNQSGSDHQRRRSTAIRARAGR